MKRTSVYISLLSIVLVASQALAQETFFGTLSDDLVFNNGVLLQGITSTTEGIAAVTLDGTGSLTAASASGGGFPRITVFGGVTITSTRTFSAEEINKTSWSGQFDTPGSTVKPGFFDINDPGAGFSDDYEAVEAFSMGLFNETFTFSTAAKFVFPVGEQDGQKLWVATQKDDDTWDVDKAVFCIVDSSLCALDLTSMDAVSLIKEKFESCPTQNIANGTVGGVPSCNYSCNSGFELNEDATGCEAVVTTEEFENSFNETTSETTTTAEQQLFENQIVAPVKEYEFPPGHFRYRASGEKFYRYLDETGLTGDVWKDPTEPNEFDLATDAGQARVLNLSYLSRNPRTAEEQLAAQATNSTAADEEANEESFISYLISMRNHFGPNAQENNYTALSAEGGESTTTETSTEDGESTGTSTEGETEGGTFLSSGPLLPSTGPGIFVTIAVVGFALMMFGARRS